MDTSIYEEEGSSDTNDAEDDVVNEGDKQIEINGTNDLICAKCFSRGKRNGAVGICKSCKYYLCSECVSEHRNVEDSASHAIAFFYCASKIKVNKLVRANYFCLDCGQYLCRKCHLDHGGFRVYRNHTFIGGMNDEDEMFDHVYETSCRSGSASLPSNKTLSRKPKQSMSRRYSRSPYREKTNATVLSHNCSYENNQIPSKSFLPITSIGRNHNVLDSTGLNNQLEKASPKLSTKHNVSQKSSETRRENNNQVIELKPKLRISSPTRSRRSQSRNRMQTEGTENYNTQAKSANTYQKPRTLIHSTTGTGPQLQKSCLKTHEDNENNVTKQKSVHYATETTVHQAKMRGVYKLRAPGDHKSCHVISSIFLGNNKLVVADKANENLKLYDEQFQLTGILDFKASRIALCNYRSNTSAFYASGENNVYRIDTFHQFAIDKLIRTEVVNIEGLASWESGIAIVFGSAASLQDKKGHFEIHLLDFEGSVRYQVTLTSPFIVQLVTPIWYIAAAEDGTQLLISDTHNNRVLCIDLKQWCIVYVIKGKDKGGLPRSLVLDTDGNILATWYDEVRKISRSGKELGTPVTGVDKKAVLAFNSQTQSLVVHPGSKADTDNFRVYQM